MKIYYIGQKGIPAKFGGVEKHVEDLSTRMAKAGHEVYVYTRPNHTDKNLRKYQGVNLISLPTIATKHLDAITHTFRACLDLTRRDVDVIHFHSIGPSFLIWLAKLLKPGVPIIFTFHTQCYKHKKWGYLARTCLKFGEATACRFADKIVAISPALVDYVKAKYKVEAVFIPNGVNKLNIVKADRIKKWGLTKNSYILTVTRLVGHKGVQYLIEAYKKLNTDKKLVIVGDGAYTDNYVKELKAAAEDNKNIIFTGNQSGAELAELFSNTYLFVQPSESEGLSIALLEAMAYRNCTLVSDIPENTYVTNGVGFSFTNKSAASLKSALEYLLNYPDLVANSGIAAQAKVEEYYNWDKIVRDILQVYQTAIESKGEHGLLFKQTV